MIEHLLNKNPSRKYKTIMIDPPWPVDFQLGSSKVKPLDYPIMTITEIAQLPVLEIADKNCRLFLWVTGSMLPEALPLLRLWRFRYRMTYTWCKSYGMGRTPANCTEFCLIATRGAPPTPLQKKGQPLIMNWMSLVTKGRHSEKPKEIIDVFESFSQSPRIELFARAERDQWTTWGDGLGSQRFQSTEV